MKIAVLDSATFGDIDLRSLETGFSETAFFEFTQPEDVAQRVVGAAVVVTNKVPLNRTHLKDNPSIKLICVAATGTDNVDLVAAREQGVRVVNVPGYSTASVASHTFAMYFHLAHKNSYHQHYTQSGAWCESPIFTHLAKPFDELAGKVWGILGMGAIGNAVANIAKAFQCRVVYYSTSGKNKDQPWQRLPLDQLLAMADVLSIHAPLNRETKGLLGRSELMQMKKKAFLINVGRGGIVDEAALAELLGLDYFAGVGLDVLEREPPPPNHPLLMGASERLFLTPHIAGLSIQARQRLILETRKNIDAFFRGEGLKNEVFA